MAPKQTRPTAAMVGRSNQAPDVSLSGLGTGRRASVLTRRQREVTALVARGYTNQQIAKELVLTPGTVANHVEQILNRLGLDSRAQATAWAVEQGLTATQDRLLTTLELLLAIKAATLKAALDQAATLIGKALGTDKVDAFVHERATDTLVAVGASDTPMGRKQRATGMDRQPVANGGGAVAVFQSGRVQLDRHVDQEPDELVGIKGPLGVRSQISVPLDVAGERRGVVVALSATPDFFSERDLRFLQAVALWVGGVVHRTELAEQLAAARVAHRPRPPLA